MKPIGLKVGDGLNGLCRLKKSSFAINLYPFTPSELWYLS
jgi:hypothetical protein